MTAAVDMMLDVIVEYREKTGMWEGATLEAFRNLHNTTRGTVGEQFLIRYLCRHGIEASRMGSRSSVYDIEVGGKKIEVKTASEGRNRSFQFNHIRLDVGYDYLLALAVSPESLRFGVWPKRVVESGAAGRLVRMARGQGITHKMTKHMDDLEPIENLPRWMAANMPPAH